jgi:hypothetical protein
MHGSGIYSWEDGRRYEGEYQNDLKDGFGVYTWKDGKKYEGFWKEGKQHGTGKIVFSNGKVKFGIWDGGKKLKWVTEEEHNENLTRNESPHKLAAMN